MLDPSVVQNVLAAASVKGAEFAEIFVEDRRGTGAQFDDGRVEQLNTGRDRGAGIRVVVGDTTGFAHTSDLTETGLIAAAQAAAAVSRRGGGTAGTIAPTFANAFADAENMATANPEFDRDVPKAHKVEVLNRANEAARNIGGELKQVSAGYGDSRRRILVANTDGLWEQDEQVRTRFVVQCVALGDGGMQTAFNSVGETTGFELFDKIDVEQLSRDAAETAVKKLQARPAPTGELPVVIKRGAGGVLFHEACGHGLEADLVKKEASVFANRVGEQVASPLVTLIDDGTAGTDWGAFRIDDEGHAAQRNTLIENGVLTDYMWDFLRARKYGHAYSGNGRRQSYQHLPMVRMTNTYVTNGDTDPQDIIASTSYGIYVAQLSGGQVNTANGDFVFGVSEAYLIENGELTVPLRDANLIGNGPAVLKAIDVIGNDFSPGWPGTCGKDGQSVPVGQGQPTLRVPTGLTIGGTAA